MWETEFQIKEHFQGGDSRLVEVEIRLVWKKILLVDSAPLCALINCVSLKCLLDFLSAESLWLLSGNFSGIKVELTLVSCADKSTVEST